MVYQHKIGGYTHLPGVAEFGKRYAFGYFKHQFFAFHHTRTFAAQLKGNRHQAFRRHFVNKFTNACTAGIKYMVKPKVVHECWHHLGTIALHQENIVFRKRFFYYLLQQKPNITEEDLPRYGLVHRIDKNTTGLIVLAKTPEAAAHLAKQFFNHTVSRKYTALVWGNVENDEGTIIAHVGRHQRHRKMFDAYPEGESGKHAITHYSVIERFNYVTLVQCRLETGRTHQIRVHMKHIGHPLFNDELYGGDKIVKGTVFSKYKQFVENCFAICPRHALHARTIGFIHPGTGKHVLFESALPDDMSKLIEKWRNYVKTRA
jgi:RluA family pseudouridine synthase